MVTELRRIRARFISLILIGLLLAPAASLGCALLFGLLNPETALATRTLALLGAFAAILAIWSTHHFYFYFKQLLNLRGASREFPPAPVQQPY